MLNTRKLLSRLGFLASLLVVAQVYASPIKITVDTSALNGIAAVLAFDFIDGDAPANSVTIRDFSSDGANSFNSSFGDVTGFLPGPMILGDTSFFSEYLQNITLGNQITFTFDTSGDLTPTTPDGFSFLILDEFAATSLVATDDPTGANALFLYSIGVTDPTQPEVYPASTIPDGQAAQPVPVRATSVPEPGALALAMAGLLALGVMRSVRKSPLQSQLLTTA